MRIRSGNGATQYTRAYSDFRGVELAGEGAKISKNRLAYSENLYRDYDGEDGSIIESIPGCRRLATLGGQIYSIILQRVGEGEEYLIIHAGDRLYRMSIAERDSADALSVIDTDMPDRKCTHFTHSGSIYLLCDGEITVVDPSGEVSRIGEGREAYSPILSLNGEAYEQRNLLTRRFRTKYTLLRPNDYSYGTPGLRYKILDRELMTCAVSGIESGVSGEVYIPAYTSIFGERYRVTEIAERAFYFATALTAVYVSEGVEKIGTQAFYYCNHIEVIHLPNTLSRICDAAFDNCQAMESLYLGSGLLHIGGSMFVGCKALYRIYYPGTAEQFRLIEGYEECDEVTKVYSSDYVKAMLMLPLAESAESVSSVREDGKLRAFSTLSSGGLISAVCVETDTTWERAASFEISATLPEKTESFNTGAAVCDGYSAILGCTVSEVFDNRVFLSGNPALPNTVFYSAPERSGAENPLYFGAFSYFNDGAGGYPVRALLSVNDSLAVFKAGDDGSGSIFYHTPATGDDYMPRVYPRSYVHSGIGALGAALTFMDDPVFICRGGVYALDKKRIDYDRNIVCRSHNVNFDLQKEHLEDAVMTEWCGYLVVVCNGTVYLADSRSTFSHTSGGTEYEWFVLKDIGGWQGGDTLYRYDTLEVGDVRAHNSPGEAYTGTVYSEEVDGELIRYGETDGTKYSLYTDGEIVGGEFSPATLALGVDRLLFFGTGRGDLLILNNDRRGVAPDELAASEDFDADEYKAAMGMRIHPSFYSREGRRVRYAMKTAYDSCDIPHLTKSTVKGSLVIRCKSCSGAMLHCEVGTGASGYTEVTSFPGGRISFDEMDLGSLALTTADYHTIPIGEKEKRWVEKQITLYSDGYASPIGISAIAYRYTVNGRIKTDA